MKFTPITPVRRRLKKGEAVIRISAKNAKANDFVFSPLASQRMKLDVGSHIQIGQVSSGQIAMTVHDNATQSSIPISRKNQQGHLVLSNSFFSNWIGDKTDGLAADNLSSVRLLVDANPVDGEIFLLTLHPDDTRVSGSSARVAALSTPK